MQQTVFHRTNTERNRRGHFWLTVTISVLIGLRRRKQYPVFMLSNMSAHVLAFLALSDMSEWLGELDLPACLLGAL